MQYWRSTVGITLVWIVDTIHISSLIVLFTFLSFLPGWWVASRIRCDELSRLCIAALASVSLLYLVEFLVYVIGCTQIVAAILLLCSAGYSTHFFVVSIRRKRFPWDALATWIASTMILAAVSSRLAVHGLPNAYWDWYEHWLRSLVFFKQASILTPIGGYRMAARGPLFNASAALLMKFGNSGQYWCFQIASVTLNSILCLPLALLFREWAGLSRRKALLVALATCVLLPTCLWNNTFTWTKNLTAAFILMAVYRYWLGLRDHEPRQLAWSLLFLAPGFLCHYLTFMYAAVLGTHLIILTVLRRWSLRPILAAVTASALFVAPWFIYMSWNIGIKRTLGSSTAVGSHDHWTSVIAVNTLVNFIPIPLCRRLLPGTAAASCDWVDVSASAEKTGRSVHFLPLHDLVEASGLGVKVSQVPYPPGLNWNGIYGTLRASGFLTMITAICLFLRERFRSARHRNHKRAFDQKGVFYLWLLTIGYLFNLLPIRWYDGLGTFSENLQAWSMILFALIVAGLRRVPAPLVALLGSAMLVEYVALDLLMIRLQDRVLPLDRAFTSDAQLPPFDPVLRTIHASTLSFQTYHSYFANYLLKLEGNAVYLRDLCAATFPIVSWVLAGTAICLLLLGHSSHRGPELEELPGKPTRY